MIHLHSLIQITGITFCGFFSQLPVYFIDKTNHLKGFEILNQNVATQFYAPLNVLMIFQILSNLILSIQAALVIYGFGILCLDYTWGSENGGKLSIAWEI